VNLPAGVLIVGVYGTGKTSVCEEIAHLLDEAGMTYGAIDLDWLGWYATAPGQAHDHEWLDRVALANLSTMVGNYLTAGVERFVLAGSVWSATELTAIRTVLPFALRVVQLTLPFVEIERRLSAAVTAGRAEDLQEAARQSDRLDTDLEDAVVPDVIVANDRPIREVADEIVGWLRWS
jgi:hypothetical protein